MRNKSKNENITRESARSLVVASSNKRKSLRRYINNRGWRSKILHKSHLKVQRFRDRRTGWHTGTTLCIAQRDKWRETWSARKFQFSSHRPETWHGIDISSLMRTRVVIDERAYRIKLARKNEWELKKKDSKRQVVSFSNSFSIDESLSKFQISLYDLYIYIYIYIYIYLQFIYIYMHIRRIYMHINDMKRISFVKLDKL